MFFLVACCLFAEQECPEDWIFQKDNASVHRSKETKEWLADNNVDVLAWPAKSPDLNIIENLCGVLVRQVYKKFSAVF